MPRTIYGGTERDRQRQLLMMTRIEKSIERLLAREIVTTTRDIVNAWEVTGRIDLPPEHPKRIEAILKTAWRASIEGGAKPIMEAAKSRNKPVITKNEDHWELFVQEYLQEWGGEKIVQITQTTLTQIMTGIDIGRAEGLGQAGIAKRILEQSPTIGYQRAALIARTEVHSASNYGSIKQAEDTGLDMLKEWIAAGGSRTRDSHRAMRRQDPIPLNEKFIVGSGKTRSEMMYPGDPDGHPAETINCRCTVAYIVLD